jgi:excisionase family DNA binding protein
MNAQRLAVDLETAAQMLSLSRRTLENFIRMKRITARKIGRRTVVRVRDLEIFLRRDQPSPGPAAQNERP